MTQRGHVLDDTWYLDYAAGALASEAEGVLVRSHIELNDEADAFQKQHSVSTFPHPWDGELQEQCCIWKPCKLSLQHFNLAEPGVALGKVYIEAMGTRQAPQNMVWVDIDEFADGALKIRVLKHFYPISSGLVLARDAYSSSGFPVVNTC